VNHQKLSTLKIGSTFTIPGDGRIMEIVRLSPSAAVVRPVRGHGKLITIDDRTIEDRSALTISPSTIVSEKENNDDNAKG